MSTAPGGSALPGITPATNAETGAEAPTGLPARTPAVAPHPLPGPTQTRTQPQEQPPDRVQRVAVIGGGPAGLMAAEVLSAGGVGVDLFDAMPSAGRKLLMAGKGGLNLTHAEPFESFVERYGAAAEWLRPLLQRHGPAEVRAFAETLGVRTFVGSSQRVFPLDMKAAPLLRTWMHRLRQRGVHVHMRHRWTGWTESGDWRFETPAGPVAHAARACVLALGGGSWSRLGSDGAWMAWLAGRGVALRALEPANCGFDVGWSDWLRDRFAGAPLKNVALSWTAPDGRRHRRLGEFVVTAGGIEGSLVYAASADLRERIRRDGVAEVEIDLLPGRERAWVERELAHPRGTRSWATHLKSRLHLDGVKAALLWEGMDRRAPPDVAAWARRIQALPLWLLRPRPLDEAISSAGGVRLAELDEHLMLRRLPGVFCAGEMLDWEAPTGGYLLTACLATGQAAGTGVLRWLGRAAPAPRTDGSVPG